MAIRHYPTILAGLSLALLLAACGEKPKQATKETDPALTGALADQIMVDPDLAGQDKSGAGISVNGPPSLELPPENRSPEAIAAAKGEALRLAGGALQQLPEPTAGQSAAEGPMSIGDVAAVGNANCASKVGYSAAWAAKMPAAFPIYPRGHTREAAGTDAEGCHLRVVNFVTPVEIGDVLAFYLTKARAAGFDGEHRLEGSDHVLGGSKGGSAYVVYARKLENGLTDVDLVTSGE